MIDKDMENKCKTLSEDISECLHIVDHDPSMALFRIQEHVRKSLPLLVDKKAQVVHLNKQLQGSCFDLENAIKTVNDIANSSQIFLRMHEHLRTAMHYKQQIDSERKASDKPRLIHRTRNDPLVQELTKSRSLDHLPPSNSQSVASRRSLSTSRADEEGNQSEPSTPTSGADSHVDSDVELGPIA